MVMAAAVSKLMVSGIRPAPGYPACPDHTEKGTLFALLDPEASDAHARPAGQLKVHTMTGIDQHFVIDAIARYRKTHPDVTFDLTMA